MTHLGYEAFDIEYEERQKLLKEVDSVVFTVTHPTVRFADEAHIRRQHYVDRSTGKLVWDEYDYADPIAYLRKDGAFTCATCATNAGALGLLHPDKGGRPFDIVGYVILPYGEWRGCNNCEETLGTLDPADGDGYDGYDVGGEG